MHIKMVLKTQKMPVDGRFKARCGLERMACGPVFMFFELFLVAKMAFF